MALEEHSLGERKREMYFSERAGAIRQIKHHTIICLLNQLSWR